MIKLETSKVIRVIADNLKLAVVPKLATVQPDGEKGVVVSIASNKVVARFGKAVFAGAYTAKGWRALPAMTSLAGKKLYTDEQAATAVQALFAAAADAKKAEQGGG